MAKNSILISARTMLLVCAIFTAHTALSQERVIKSEKHEARQKLYLHCQDQARTTSSYIGFVPSEYVGENILDSSFDRGRSDGWFDPRPSGFRPSDTKSGNFGVKFTFKFGKTNQYKKKPFQQRRSFRSTLDSCMQTNN